MGVPIRESDDSEPSEGEPLKSELPENEPARNDPLREASQRAGGTAPPDKTTESPEPPQKSRARRGVFEGDAAAVELRSRLAGGPDERSRPAARVSSAPRPGGFLRFTGLLLAAAAVAGLTGYLLAGFRMTGQSPVEKSPRIAPGAANLAAAGLQTANRDSPPPARAPAADFAAGDARRAEAARAPATAPQSAAPTAASPSPPPQDADEIAARMKLGADLVANGDIAAARTMFQRVAEAGEAAGAFALAETYDPAVLRTLRLRGGITADPELARLWYQKARDLGSIVAAERITRLTQNPR